MISRLPRWVRVGACVLAFGAGMINVVAMLGFAHQPISHLTASTSRLSISMAEHDRDTFFEMVRVIGSFLIGAVLSGWLIQSSVLQLGRRYSAALVLESLLLCAAVVALRHENRIGIYLCGCACGLQNGLASSYSGAIVRTTHMTGIFTDLGVLFGQRLRGVAIDRRKLSLYLSILIGFCGGGIVGAFLFPKWGSETLLIPAALTGMAAATYEIYRLRELRRSPVIATEITS